MNKEDTTDYTRKLYINGLKHDENTSNNYEVNKRGRFNIGKHKQYIPIFDNSHNITLPYKQNYNCETSCFHSGLRLHKNKQAVWDIQ